MLQQKTDMQNDNIVKTRALSRIYQMGSSEVRALDDVSLDIAPGEFVALVGSSGSGKSTLLNLIAGLDRPTSGEVYVCGRSLQEMTQRELATHRKLTVGMVFQSFNLIPSMTAAENVSLALAFAGVVGVERKERAEKVLSQVGLADRARHRPGELSGGEMQRTAIARALVNHPELLLADEPTGNLDGRTSMEIMELLESINREDGRTIILVTHDEALAGRFAHRALRLSYGRLINHQEGQA